MTYYGYRGRHRADEPHDPFTGPYLPQWLLNRYPH